MRILLIADFYPPYAGGVEHHVARLANGLAERGHAVAVATLAGSGSVGLSTDGAISVHRLAGLVHRSDRLFTAADRPWAPPLPDPGLARALRAVVATERPDVIHGHDWLLRSVLPVLPRSVPLVSTLHYYSRSCAKKNLLRDGAACPGPAPIRCTRCVAQHYGRAKGPVILAAARLGAAWERRATAVTLAVSSACAEGNETDANRVRVVANSRIDGIPAPSVEGLPDGPFMLYVGDLRPEKGVPVLLEAYESLAERPPLAIVGGMGHVPSPYDRLDDVHLLGERSHSEVLAAFERCLFSVVPSIWEEPFGLVVLEAMAAGKPVVASAIGGITDIVTDGVDGLLAQPGRAESFAAAIRRLLENREERESMGSAAAQTARRYAPETMLDEIEALYREVMDGARAAEPGAPSSGQTGERRIQATGKRGDHELQLRAVRG